MKNINTYYGIAMIIGRSNVGKSTLLNYILGHHLSITSKKSQSTKYCITGIKTHDIYQTLYIDTPGIYVKHEPLIHQSISYITNNSIKDITLIIFVVEGIHWTKEEKIIVNNLRKNNIPVLIVINKIDRIKCKHQLLPYIQFLTQQMSFVAIIPVSAIYGTNIDILTTAVHKILPSAKHVFPANHITNHSQKFITSEIIREKLIQYLRNELPYIITVQIESFDTQTCGIYNIYALILVKHTRQKKIVIGTQGEQIKMIGIRARKDLEQIFKVKVNLKLWVQSNDKYNISINYFNEFNHMDNVNYI